MLSVTQVAEITGKSASSVRAAIAKKLLPATQVSLSSRPHWVISFVDVKRWIGSTNPFRLGSRMYCFYEVFLKHHGVATKEQLIQGCLARRKSLQGETEALVARDLNNQIHYWLQGKWGLKVHKRGPSPSREANDHQMTLIATPGEGGTFTVTESED